MMKIGSQMVGRIVVCPQCGAKLEVPTQSDPQAEALYQFMKKKRAQEKAAQILGSVEPKRQIPLPTAQPAPPPPPKAAVPTPPPTAKPKPSVPTLPTTTQPVPKPVHQEPPPEESFEELEPDEVDLWIDEFWATVPETDGEFDPNSIPHTLKHAPVDGPTNDLESASAAVRYRQTVVLFRVWLSIVFLVGLIAGIYIHSVYADFRNRRTARVGTGEAVTESDDRTVQGNLYYRGFDGRPMPDADAVVILLPLDRNAPAVPMSIEGLRPNDEMIAPNVDGAQQITELGGHFLRTGADGAFSVSLKTPGRFLVLMISSHARRNDGMEPETAAIRELGRFFRTPEDLLGQYGFALEEYDFMQGKYMLHRTF